MAQRVRKIVKSSVDFFDICVENLGYLFSYERELLKLREQLGHLETVRYGFQIEVDEAMRNGETLQPEDMMWLLRVDRVLEEGVCLFTEIRSTRTRRWSLCDMKSHYMLGRKVKKMTLKLNEVVDSKHELRTINTGVTRHRGDPSSDLTGTFIKPIELSVLDALGLADDQINIVGMYGVGIDESVANRVLEVANAKKIFDEVVKVNVMSTHPNSYKIQGDLGKKLGLQFKEGESMSERGKRVHERLTKSRRTLVIFYDVKDKFDLCNVGLIQGHDEYRDGYCKVVVISSDQWVCSAMGIKRRIHVPGDYVDRRDYFKRMAGDWMQKADRECIAFEFVDQYCGRYSKSKDEKIRKLAEETNKWIKEIESSYGINVPDAGEVNRRRISLFTDAAQASSSFLRLC